jgi:enoyl-CoA hydratase
MPDRSRLRYEVVEGVATITLDDPDTRNSLSPQLLEELLAALRECRADDAARCLVLASSHEKVFSSGANLGAFGTDAPITDRHAGSLRFVEVFRAIGELGKPSLVAANGHVLAGSLGIALACDLIVAKEGATFGTPEINVGLFPFMIMALIYRNVPRKKTNEMLLLGERLSAEEAREAGIVNKVVPAGGFDAAVADWAAKLASKSPAIMRLGKDAMWRQMDMPLADALDYLRAQLTIELGTEDAAEGVKAFFGKREPQWKGR